MQLFKGQLISKWLLGVVDFLQKTNENKSTWGIIVVKSNLFIPFFERNVGLKNNFDFVWPLNFEEISHEIDGVYFLHLLLDRGFGPIILDLLSYEGLQRLYQPQKLCDLADLEDAM